jgi:uncharacterized surface protein with fasciclin (FAS1) repeats
MSTIRRAVLALTLAAPLAIAGAPAFAQDKDIVDTAVANKDFSTLVAAVKATGLADTLKGKGPFTVFAPTDEAFKKLPAGTLDSLLKPENKKRLTSILTYHVLPGTYDAARITKPTIKQFGIKSVEGSNVDVDLRKGVIVSGATVGKTDIKASNGIIHVVDTVMIPRKVRFAMAAEAATEKAKAALSKAGEATKAAAGKAMEAAKGAAAKVKEAIKPTPPTPATVPGSQPPATGTPAAAPKKP